MSGAIIIGSGRGSWFAEMLIKELHYPVVAMVEPNTAIHPQLRQRMIDYGSPNTRIMSSTAEALSTFPVEVADRAFIVTPNSSHAAILAQLLESNRHVFLEKPVAASVEDVDYIEKLCKNTTQVIQLGFVLRYSAFYRKIHNMIMDNAVGQVIMIQMNEYLDNIHGSTYRRGWRRLIANTGGFMNEKCSHDLDLMCWFKSGRAKPTTIYSVGGQHLFNRKAPAQNCPECQETSCPFRATTKSSFGQQYQIYTDLKLHNSCVYATDADILNHQHVTIGFSDGSHGHLGLIACSGHPGRDIVIHGTYGYLAGSLAKGKIEYVKYDAQMTRQDISVSSSDMHGGGDLNLLNDFYRCIDDGFEPKATVSDGILATRLAFAADASVAQNKVIQLDCI